MLNLRPASRPPQLNYTCRIELASICQVKTGCCSSKAVKAKESHVNGHDCLRSPLFLLFGRTACTAFESVAIAARRRGAKRNSCSSTKSRERSSFSLRTRLARSPLHLSWHSSGPLVGSAVGIRVARLKAGPLTAG